MKTAMGLRRALMVRWRWFWRGAAMACAELVPGVSGGTVALLFGVYDDILRVPVLLSSARWWKLLYRRPMRALALIRTGALFWLVVGMAITLLLMAGVISWLRAHYPGYINGFFAGLVISGGLVLMRPLAPSMRWLVLPAALLTSLALAYASEQTVWPQEPLWVLLAGVLAASAWILPGLSGALVLVMLGAYDAVLGWLNSLDFFYLAWFGAGVCIGVLLMGRAVGMLWRRYRDPITAILVGLMLGSVIKLWPGEWQALSTVLVGLLVGWSLSSHAG